MFSTRLDYIALSFKLKCSHVSWSFVLFGDVGIMLFTFELCVNSYVAR